MGLITAPLCHSGSDTPAGGKGGGRVVRTRTETGAKQKSRGETGLGERESQRQKRGAQPNGSARPLGPAGLPAALRAG